MGDPSKRARAPKQTDEGREPPSFEASLSRLEAIVERLEGGDLTLEQSLALFEEGVGIARMSQQQLDQAERRVEELLAIDAEGNPVVRDLTKSAPE